MSLNRRCFFQAAGATAVGLGACHSAAPKPPDDSRAPDPSPRRSGASGKPGQDDPSALLFLCGDVMTGRGIDQILPHPSDPVLYESYIKDANDYVRLAELVHGQIPRPVPFDYIWGGALAELQLFSPDGRIINLETSVTTSNDWQDKGINYRMNPENVGCLKAAGIDGCVLSNNHVLDWGRAGLIETLETLHRAGIQTAGAGLDLNAARAPAVVAARGQNRVLVFAYGLASSGIPESWGAGTREPGVNLLPELSADVLEVVAENVDSARRPGDIVVISIHWGSNWGYDVPLAQQEFAHGLIEVARADLIHGHSSHHAKAVEVHRGKLIVYGAGDLVNDYEGIGGHEQFRGDLSLMYFARLSWQTGRLLSLRMTPVRSNRLRLRRAVPDETRFLRDTLEREGARFGTGAAVGPDGRLYLRF